MTQSSLGSRDARADRSSTPSRLHLAIVMDGNGRWAKRRGLPRTAGHRAGASAVRRTIAAAAARDVGTLTLYAFSSDNWRRPPAEVRHLMRLFRTHLHSEAARCQAEGVRVRVIGRRDRLAPGVVAAIEAIEARTRDGDRLHLQLAVDYSARDAILEAARLHGTAEAGIARSAAPTFPRPERAGPDAPPAGGAPSDPAPSTLAREEFSRLLARALHAEAPMPDVDLLVRTGGEQRLSDFLLWECAYAELVFTPRLWPDFGGSDLDRALAEFRRRERRFGGIPALPEAEPSHAVPPDREPSRRLAAATPSRRSRDGEARAHG